MIIPKYVSTLVLTIAHDKPIKDLSDLVADRAWSMDHVTSASAMHVCTVEQKDAGKWVRDTNPTETQG
jgi:hypothetical protein